MESDSKGPFLLDEEHFIRECASRINSFFAQFPEEARAIFRTQIPYRHELLDNLPPDLEHLPFMVVGGIICGIFQTHRGSGWYMRPKLTVTKDKKIDIVGVEIVRQKTDDNEKPKS
jgi:hypothetical protein